MIYAYIRISTDHQHQENQQYEIETFAQNNNININKWIKETISSRKNLEDRKLGTLLKQLKKNDILIASEISRLGRNLMQVMSILHHCMKVGCQVWTIKDNYRLGSDLQSKVLAFAFSLSAEIERDLISQRTKQSLARRKAENKPLGRPKGIHHTYSKLAQKEKLIKQHLSENKSKNELAKKLKVNYSTLYRYLKKFHPEE